MTSEKYVDTITRKIKCSKSRRMEIRRQLLSDIETARENGEALEDILQRMGNAFDVADEFNRNLPEEERKTYSRKKRLKIILAVAIIIVAAVCVIYRMMPKGAELGTSGVFEQNTVEEQAKWIIEELDENDFDTLLGASDAAMQQALTPEVIEDARIAIGDDWGDFLSYGKMYMSELKQNGQIYACTQMTVTYENVSVTYTILFDKEMKLAGLFMK